MSTERWTVSGPQVIDVEAVDRIEVGLVGGRIDVVTHEGPGARVEVHSVVGRPIEVSVAGGTLKVGYSFLGLDGFIDRFRSMRDKDRADVYVAVPAAVAAKIGVVSAEGMLSGVQGGGSVATVSGSVVVDGTAGTLRLNSVSGEMTVRAHVGDLTANSVSGDVTVSGDLSTVSFSTVSGDATLDLVRPPATLKVDSVSGDVVARMPEPDALTYTVHTMSGRTLVDGVRHQRSRGEAVQLAADGVGRGRATVNTVSGDVTVLRADVDPGLVTDGATVDPYDAPYDGPSAPDKDRS